MKLTDTHCHLADPAFKNRLPHILQQAAEQGVWRFVVPAAHRGDWDDVLELWENFSESVPHGFQTACSDGMPSENRIRIALGIHPWFAQTAQEEDFAELERLLRRHPQAWVGEIGLDFLKNAADEAQKRRQADVFCRQLELAQRLRRRVIVHNVKAGAAVAAAVKESGFAQGGIVHAFSGSTEEARMLVKLGFKIGIGTLLLNPNAKKVRQAVQQLDLKDLVLETDSPFMLKNAVNTPANVRRVAELAAELRGIGTAELAAQTERNADGLWHAADTPVLK